MDGLSCVNSEDEKEYVVLQHQIIVLFSFFAGS